MEVCPDIGHCGSAASIASRPEGTDYPISLNLAGLERGGDRVVRRAAVNNMGLVLWECWT